VCKKSYRDQYYNAKGGCVELKLSSWKEFVDYIYFTDLDHSQYIWRGQRCENWPLKSARDRALDGINSGRDNGQRLRVPSLNDFKLAVRGRRGVNPPRIDTDNDWWALGQHYGLITPLLDWTESPFVAAYFAFIEQGEEQTDYRAIYALHVSTLEAYAKVAKWRAKSEALLQKYDDKNENDPIDLLIKGKRTQGINGFEYVRPLLDENLRLVNQSGCFTKVPEGVSVEELVREKFKGCDGEEFLIKILIPDTERDNGLRMLNRMNINHSTLFPDISGASQYLNVYAKIDRY